MTQFATTLPNLLLNFVATITSVTLIGNGYVLQINMFFFMCNN